MVCYCRQRERRAGRDNPCSTLPQLHDGVTCFGEFHGERLLDRYCTNLILLSPPIHVLVSTGP